MQRQLNVQLLLGHRTGDNDQARALAAALGGQASELALSYNGLYRVPNVVLGARLSSLDRQSRSRPFGPWPDLVIATGRRSVPVARWIKRQSGGRTKLVQIGRPRAPLNWFDLVVTSPQYRLPQAPNVVHTLLPFVAGDEALPSGLESWRRRFAQLPRPWFGVLAGGAKFPYRFGVRGARRLAGLLDDMVKQRGGAVLVSTSPRTGRAAAEALAGAISAPGHVHVWGRDEDNPHRAILALADEFVVTSETVSMMAEACRSGRPVAVYDLARMRLAPGWPGGALAAKGLISPPRQVSIVRDMLIAGGHCTVAGGPPPGRCQAAVPDDRAMVVARIRQLFE